MSQIREELIQSLLEKQENLFRGMHGHHLFKAGKLGFGHSRKHGLPFQDLDLSRSQIFLLFMVAKSKDGLSVKDISRFLFISSGGVTQHIDTLIEKNLVQREEDPVDRRALKIKLTDYAKTRFANFKKGFINNIAHVFDNLSDDELKEFVRLVDKIKPLGGIN
jgi:DNA-binding MarR family transcriptional regulator